MEILLIIGGLVGLVWGTVLLARGGALAGCLAILLAGSCFGHSFFHLPMGPIPLTLDRLLWAVVLGVYVVGRRWGWAERRPPARADWFLAAFFAVLLASTLLHDWRRDGAAPLARFLFFHVMPLGVYWVARNCRMSAGAVTATLYSFVGFGLYLALTGLAETHGQWWAVFPKYIANSEYREFLGRARGPFLNPIACGYFVGVGLFAAMLLWSRQHRVGRVALAAACFVLCLGVHATLTRSVWIGAALGILIVVLLKTPRRWRAPLFGGAMLLGLLVAGTQWDRLMSYKRDRALTAKDAAESVLLRPILARVAWNMFLDRPLFGCGYGQYMVVQRDYLADRSTGLPLSKARPYEQHNVFLSLLTETGLIGMGLFVVVLTLWTLDAWRLSQAESLPDESRSMGLLFLAMMGLYLANAMFHDLSLMPMANMLLFFMAGATSAASSQLSPSAAYYPSQWPAFSRRLPAGS